MRIQDAVVLVTGANRGIGLAFAEEALARGARKVYAGARRPEEIKLKGVVPVRLDVTQPIELAALAKTLSDVTLVINNAGIGIGGSLLDADSSDVLRKHFDTNVFGVLDLTRAFAPVLVKNGGGGFINVHSVVSWISSAMLGSYATSKAAVWGLTNNLRLALSAQNTQVLGLHMGFVDTDLARGIDMPKTSPQVIVQRTYDALEAGESEVAADEITQKVKSALSAGVYLKPVER
jgi:NAD(P)-dependent dehydrogenase (short-subunit alcohol dehydrogenase family)